MASVRLEGIHKAFGEVKALVDITQEIGSGEFFTLLGPSGCGKTTLLRTVAGFYFQDRGHVFIGDTLVDTVPAHRRNTGMVFQNYAVFPHMTVFQNVAFGLENRRIAKAEIKRRVSKTLEMARLGGLEGRTPDQLSGGQQQRVGLARAMVIEPLVLLMDEPLSNLDAKLRVEMREEIRDIQRALGITTIYVTHDQEEALAISDRIAVINNGVVHQVGTGWDIYKAPRDRFVASFVGNTFFFEGKVSGSTDGYVRIVAGEQEIRARKPASDARDLLFALRPEDLTIHHEAPSADDGSVLPAVVEKSVFTGSLVRYTVSCTGSLRLVIEHHKPEREALIDPGRKVFVRIPVESVMVFDAEDGKRL